MTTAEDIVLVKIIEEVINSMQVPDVDNKGQFLKLNYEPGRSIQILKSINELDNSISEKNLKYPLFAMLMPIREKMGTPFPAQVKIPRIVIATLTKTGTGTEKVLDKYDSDGVFKTILYPCYYEFLKRICMSRRIIGMETNNLVHEKMDNPCQQQEGQNTNHFIDSIEIFNLELILNQLKTC